MTEENTLDLAMLGPFRVFRSGGEVGTGIKYRKGIALLGWLAVHKGVWQEREKLAELLWPSLAPGPARTNLRQILNNLSAVLETGGGASPLERNERALRLKSVPGLSIDIDLLAGDPPADEAALAAWCQALERLGPGIGTEFLKGLRLADTPDFDDWLLSTRQHFRARGTQALERLCRYRQENGHLPEAIASARLLVALAPLHEPHVARLIELLAAAGDRAGALAAFTALKQRLARELGAAPGPALLRLCERIERDQPDDRTTPVHLPELRFVAMLYCDFGFLPEDAAAADAAFIDETQTLIRRWGGSMVSAFGRGMLAVFGLDTGIERSAERALRAADAIRKERSRRGSARLAVCAGQILLQGTGAASHVLGEIPDQTMLLGWSAANGEILANRAAMRQAGGAFVFEPLGRRDFPGVGGVEVFRLSAGPRSRLDDGEEMPFTGRRDELHELLSMWAEAGRGKPAIALLRAPAGLGKTRLARELAARVGAAGGQVRYLACRLELQHQPLAPVLASLETLAEVDRDDAPVRRQEKIAQTLSQTYPELGPDNVAALSALAGGGDSLQAKSVAFAGVLRLIAVLGERAPTLLVVDDLHWSDQSSLELLGLLAAELAGRPILMVMTSRADVLPECPPHLIQRFELAPLPSADALALVSASDVDGLIPATEQRRIVDACGGIPLFVERLAKSWREGMDHRLPVDALLLGELDRLGGAKNVLRAASVLGERFNADHLAALLPDAPVAAALDEAAGQRLIVAGDGGGYRFRHALIRDAAYQSLPRKQRHALHRHAAWLTVERSPSSSEAIAGHFDAAECWTEAAEWWTKAGEMALAREFSGDAMRCFERALKALEARGGDEAGKLPVRMQLGYAAMMAQGFGSALAHRLFTQAADWLSARPDAGASHRRNLFAALSGCYMGGSSQGKVEGLNIARRLEKLATTDAERLMACFALGNSLFWRGEFIEAETWQRRGITLADRVAPGDRIRYCVDDPAITCRAFLGWNLWFLGEEAEARRVTDEGIALARKGRRTHALCFMLTFAVGVAWCLDDVDEVRRLGGEALALSSRYGLPLWESVNRLFLLWAQARSGGQADAETLLGAAEMMRTAYQAGITTSRWIVIRALRAQGVGDKAEALADLTIHEADLNEDQYCLADLLWLKGEFLAARGDRAGAGEYRGQARRMAESQQSTGFLARFADQSNAS